MLRSKKYSARIALIGAFACSLTLVQAQDYQSNDQPSLYQRVYRYVSDRPIATAIAGASAVGGAYALSSKYGGSLANLIKSQGRQSLFQRAYRYVSNRPVTAAIAGASAIGGAYVLSGNDGGYLADSVKFQGHRVKSTLLGAIRDDIPTFPERMYIKHIAKSLSCRKLLAIVASLSLAYFNDKSGHRVSIKKQIGCAVFLYCLAYWQRSLMVSQEPEWREAPHEFKYLLDSCVTAPIAEEIIYTYIPYALLGEYAKCVMPARFGASHWHFSIEVQMFLALVNFNNYCALQAGYIYTPVFEGKD